MLFDRYVVCQVTHRTIASAIITPTRGTIVTSDAKTNELELDRYDGNVHTSSSNGSDIGRGEVGATESAHIRFSPEGTRTSRIIHAVPVIVSSTSVSQFNRA